MSSCQCICACWEKEGDCQVDIFLQVLLWQEWQAYQIVPSKRMWAAGTLRLETNKKYSLLNNMIMRFKHFKFFVVKFRFQRFLWVVSDPKLWIAYVRNGTCLKWAIALHGMNESLSIYFIHKRDLARYSESLLEFIILTKSISITLMLFLLCNISESYGERENWRGFTYTIPSTMTILPYEMKWKYIKYDHMG
jgi:hypothetical protein